MRIRDVPSDARHVNWAGHIFPPQQVRYSRIPFQQLNAFFLEYFPVEYGKIKTYAVPPEGPHTYLSLSHALPTHAPSAHTTLVVRKHERSHHLINQLTRSSVAHRTCSQAMRIHAHTRQSLANPVGLPSRSRPIPPHRGSAECLFSTYFSRIRENMEIAQNTFFLREFLEKCVRPKATATAV